MWLWEKFVITIRVKDRILFHWLAEKLVIYKLILEIQSISHTLQD